MNRQIIQDSPYGRGRSAFEILFGSGSAGLGYQTREGSELPIDGRRCPLGQPSFHIAIDSVKKLLGKSGGKIGPPIARQVEQREQKVVE